MNLGAAAVTVATPDGASLGVADGGRLADRDRPLAVLQHGFPDSPVTWRHLAPVLTGAGYRVAAPWLRGYGPSTAGKRAGLDALVDDLATVHRALGGDDRAVLVGHDWGAAAGWRSLEAPASPWRAAVLLAVPVEAAMRGHLVRPVQLWRSRYQLEVQLPGAALRRSWPGVRPLLRLWRRWSPGYTPDEADREGLVRALGTHAQLHAALGHYRAMALPTLRGQFPRADGLPAPVPTLYLHGSDDRCYGPEHAVATGALLAEHGTDSTARVLVGTGHFLHLEAPDQVADAVLDHLERTA